MDTNPLFCVSCDSSLCMSHVCDSLLYVYTALTPAELRVESCLIGLLAVGSSLSLLLNFTSIKCCLQSRCFRLMNVIMLLGE